jgi:hypothetical protein
MTAKAVIVALTLVAAGPVLAGENPFDNGRGFDWDRYHAGQDACAEKDRIAAQCAYWAICDERALRQAQRVCSAFGPAFPRSPEPPSPPWASPLVGQDRKLGTQNRSLTAADHRGASFDDRRGRAQRDCPPRRCCAVDCPADAETADERGAQLAIAG